MWKGYQLAKIKLVFYNPLWKFSRLILCTISLRKWVIGRLVEQSGFGEALEEIAFLFSFLTNFSFLYRCGDKYMIPGYRLQGQCDPDSRQPCCNVETGWCGGSHHYCNCDKCTDARSTLPAELADWIPHTCDVKQFSHKETCRLLQRYGIHLTFLGKFHYFLDTVFGIVAYDPNVAK